MDQANFDTPIRDLDRNVPAVHFVSLSVTMGSLLVVIAVVLFSGASALDHAQHLSPVMVGCGAVNVSTLPVCPNGLRLARLQTIVTVAWFGLGLLGWLT